MEGGAAYLAGSAHRPASPRYGPLASHRASAWITFLMANSGGCTGRARYLRRAFKSDRRAPVSLRFSGVADRLFGSRRGECLARAAGRLQRGGGRRGCSLTWSPPRRHAPYLCYFGLRDPPYRSFAARPAPTRRGGLRCATCHIRAALNEVDCRELSSRVPRSRPRASVVFVVPYHNSLVCPRPPTHLGGRSRGDADRRERTLT